MKKTYFASSESFVKIGSTRNVVSRIAAISTSCPFPVELLKVVDDLDENGAKWIAGKLAERCNGEWFRKTPALMEWIRTGVVPIGSDPNPHIRLSGESRTRVVFDLRDVLSDDELKRFEASAREAGAPSLTDHFLNLTLRKPDKAA